MRPRDIQPRRASRTTTLALPRVGSGERNGEGRSHFFLAFNEKAMAGEPSRPPTPHSRSGCSFWSARVSRSVCAHSCSRWSSWTTSSHSSSSRPSTRRRSASCRFSRAVGFYAAVLRVRASLSDKTGVDLFRARSVCLGKASSSPEWSRSSSELQWDFSPTRSRRRDRISSGQPSVTGSSENNRQSELARLAGRRAEIGDVGQRAAAAEVSPLDELRHRPSLCARERWHRDRRQLLGRALTSPITLGIFFGYVWEAARHPRLVLARHPVEPRTSAAACRLGGGRRGRHDRRDRLHGRAPRLHTRLRREASSRKRSSEY